MITTLPAVFYNGANLKEVVDFTGRDPRFWDEFPSWEGFERHVADENGVIVMTLRDGTRRVFYPGSWVIRMPDGNFVCGRIGPVTHFGPMYKNENKTPAENK